MSQYIDNLFSTSVQESVQTTVTSNKPLFVYLYRDNRVDSNFLDRFIDQNITNILKDNFVLLKLVQNSPEYVQFNQIYTKLIVPSFNIIWRGKVVGLITEDKTKDFFQRLIETISENLADTIIHTTTNSSQATDAAGTASTTPQQRVVPPPSPPGGIVSSSRSSDVNTKKLNEAHELNVKKHKLQTEQLNRDQLQEKKRLRELLKADQRERELLQKEQMETSPKPEPVKQEPKINSEDICLLSLKLFDGSSIKHEFKCENTLSDVRSWLDNEIGIIPTNEDMPAFVAKNSYPHPTNYAFHRPVLPRITYSEEQETKSLSELELTPRSALILKPIYHEQDSTGNDGDAQNVGYIRSVFGFVGRLGNALYSFFDYGTGNEYQEVNEEAENKSEQQQVNLGLVDDIQLGLGNPGHTIVSIDDNRVPPSSQSSSIFNIEHPNIRNTRENNNFPSRPSSPKLGESNRNSAYPSRSNTPRPSGVNRIQMFQEEDKDKKGVDTYNGNSVNLNERDDDESK